MVNVIIPFEAERGSLDNVKTIIRDFIRGITKNEPGTIFYRSFQEKENPARFIHVMSFEDEKAQDIHRNSSYCREFVSKLYPLCTKAPEAVLYDEVG